MDHLHSEEDVKIKFLLPFLEARGYKQNCIAFNVSIEVTEGLKRRTIFADAVVYTSAKKDAPLVLCETKAPSEILNRQVREQAISYARLLPRIAPLTLITNGAQVQVLHTLNKARIPELPLRKALEKDILSFVIDPALQEALRQEAKHELFIIDDVQVFKGILKASHNEIRNNDGLDPTAAFDEMSKVMFCKLYEEKRNPQGNRFRLSVFDDSLERLGINIVHKILQEAKNDPAYAGVFTSEAVINLQDRTVRRIVEFFERYDFGLTAFDVKGEAFEYFLGDTFTGGLGEYFTPRNIVEFMVDAYDPKIGESIIDPFCGTGGFLIYSFELVCAKIRLQEFSDEEKLRWKQELSNRCLYGTDWKERTSQACKMNMVVHGDGSSGVFRHDGFVDVAGVISEGQFDLCLTNPPFGAFENSAEILSKYELGAGRKSQDRVILAIERSLRLVKPGGRVAIVVIDGVLNNSSTKYVRDYIKRVADIQAVVSLNKETFEGYGARAKTSILFLKKKLVPDNTQTPVFMAIATNTGLAPNGDQIPGNVLPEILMDFREFLMGRTSEPRAESWVCEVDDRLDVEYYNTKVVSIDVDVVATQELLNDALLKMSTDMHALTALQGTHESVATVRMKIGEVLEQVKEKETVDPATSYRLLGVRWWGKGVFAKSSKKGSDQKAKTLFRVPSGTLIYNKLFAFKGSFAIVPEEFQNCFVSGEFPIFRVREGVENPDLVLRYIVQQMNSPQFAARVDRQSTGSTQTSRNRFSITDFLGTSIDVPEDKTELQEVIKLIDSIDKLRVQAEEVAELVKTLRVGVQAQLPPP